MSVSVRKSTMAHVSDVDELVFHEEDDTEVDENTANTGDQEQSPWDIGKEIHEGSMRLKSSFKEPSELKLKGLPEHLEYVFLAENFKLPIIIASNLIDERKGKLVTMLKKHKEAITWKTVDINGVSPSFYTHKILIKDNFKSVVQPQRRLNLNMKDVVKTE